MCKTCETYEKDVQLVPDDLSKNRVLLILHDYGTGVGETIAEGKGETLAIFIINLFQPNASSAERKGWCRGKGKRKSWTNLCGDIL